MTHALYYPFHLCHERTLERLLEDYETIHFRDFMALRLTPLMGTTAFPDRMGDYYPQHLAAGRIIQGHELSGSMTPKTVSAVNQDLTDPLWRHRFHESILNDHRFQRGLFSDPQDTAEHAQAENKPEWLQFHEGTWEHVSLNVEIVQALSRQRLEGEKASLFEYGWAMIKTAASLIYTIRLCHQLKMTAVTDSAAHYHLLAQTHSREHSTLDNIYLKREGY